MGYSEMARRLLWDGGSVRVYLRNRWQPHCRRADDFGVLCFLGTAFPNILKGKTARKALPYNLHRFPRNHYDGYFRGSGGIKTWHIILLWYNKSEIRRADRRLALITSLGNKPCHWGMGGLFLFYAQYVACGKYQNKYDKNRLLHRQRPLSRAELNRLPF